MINRGGTGDNLRLAPLLVMKKGNHAIGGEATSLMMGGGKEDQNKGASPEGKREVDKERSKVDATSRQTTRGKHAGAARRREF